MGGRDHSCEGCGRGGFDDPDGVCECPTADALAREPRWTISGVEVIPASALQEVERERDELREALRKIADGEKVTKPHGDPRDGVQYVTFLTPRQIARAALSNPKEGS